MDHLCLLNWFIVCDEGSSQPKGLSRTLVNPSHPPPPTTVQLGKERRQGEGRWSCQYLIWYTEAQSPHPVTTSPPLYITSQHVTAAASWTCVTACWVSPGDPGASSSPPGASGSPLHRSTCKSFVPVGILWTVMRLSIPTLTHHWPGRRQRGQ